MAGLIGLIGERYYILDEIGQGGMTTVYKALDLIEDREVALKVLSPYLVKDPKFKARFEREVEVLRQLEHPNIVPILNYGEHDGAPFIVMPFMPTGTLEDRLRSGPLSPKEGSRLVREISSALAHAHEMGIVHRDIKPSNFLVDEEGNALLSDFGLAHLHDDSKSLTGSAVIGTPAYMSPEQCGAGPIDARSDQYSFSVVLFQLTTGHLPFDADTPIAVALKHINEPLPRPRDLNPNLPEPIEAVLIKALSKNPSHRYPSISAFNDAFQRAIRLSMSKGGSGWASHLYQVTQVLDRIRYKSTLSLSRMSKRSVLLGSVLLLFGVPLAAYALFGPNVADPTDDLRATIAVLYTQNAPREGTPQQPSSMQTAVAGTISVLEAQLAVAVGSNTPDIIATPTLTEGLEDSTDIPLRASNTPSTATPTHGFFPTSTHTEEPPPPPPPSPPPTPTLTSTPEPAFTATEEPDPTSPPPTPPPAPTKTPGPKCKKNPNPNFPTCTPAP